MRTINTSLYAVAALALATMLTTGCTTEDTARADIAPIAATATPGTGDKQSTDGKGFYAPINGMELYYEIRGAGAPLVLVHGGLGTIDGTFGALIPELAETRQVIAVELQAHGRTADIDRPLRYELMADDVADLIAHLGVEQTDVLGYSLGGGVALQLAARNPDLVNKLVVTSAPYRYDGWTPETQAGMAAMDPAAMIGSPVHEIYLRSAPNPQDWPALVTKARDLLTRDYDWTEQISAINAPTLVVTAESDAIQRSHTVELVDLLDAEQDGAAKLEIVPGTTHYDVMFRADLLLPIISSFL
ncbi:alpha/beta fold hydrolase [Nocardia sp. NPDC055321]